MSVYCLQELICPFGSHSQLSVRYDSRSRSLVTIDDAPDCVHC